MTGCDFSVRNARRRKQSLPSMRSNRRAISRGIRLRETSQHLTEILAATLEGNQKADAIPPMFELVCVRQELFMGDKNDNQKQHRKRSETHLWCTVCGQ